MWRDPLADFRATQCVDVAIVHEMNERDPEVSAAQCAERRLEDAGLVGEQRAITVLSRRDDAHRAVHRLTVEDPVHDDRGDHEGEHSHPETETEAP